MFLPHAQWEHLKLISNVVCFLDVIMMFPKMNQCNQDVLKMTKCDQNVPTNHMVETF